jgi:hypothetical protein
VEFFAKWRNRRQRPGSLKRLPNCKPWKLRALSTSSTWGEHRLAQEVGLFRDVLLHRRNMKEILFFFNGIYSY